MKRRNATGTALERRLGDRDGFDQQRKRAALGWSARYGLPIVASRTGGIPDVLGHAWPELVDPDQVTPLAVCLVRLARDQGLRHELGTAAQARAETFDARPGVQRLAAVYDRV